jgi:DNA-binding transcriptional LysR family regulator
VRLILSLVAATDAVALVPRMGWSGDEPGVVVLPLTEGPLNRRVFTAVRRGTGDRPAQRAVRDALAEQARALGLQTA